MPLLLPKCLSRLPHPPAHPNSRLPAHQSPFASLFISMVLLLLLPIESSQRLSLTTSIVNSPPFQRQKAYRLLAPIGITRATAFSPFPIIPNFHSFKTTSRPFARPWACPLTKQFLMMPLGPRSFCPVSLHARIATSQSTLVKPSAKLSYATRPYPDSTSRRTLDGYVRLNSLTVSNRPFLSLSRIQTGPTLNPC